ncbi:hypothetical protein JZ751_014156, partial [Albula glossodonta]
MLPPLMLPLRSTRKISSLVVRCSSTGSLSRSGQKFSIITGGAATVNGEDLSSMVLVNQNLTFFSHSDSFLAQRMKSRRAEICCSYSWKDYLQVPVIRVLLCQGDVRGRSALGAGVRVCPQGMTALFSCQAQCSVQRDQDESRLELPQQPQSLPVVHCMSRLELPEQSRQQSSIFPRLWISTLTILPEMTASNPTTTSFSPSGWLVMPREQPLAQDLMQEPFSSRGAQVERFRRPGILSAHPGQQGA